MPKFELAGIWGGIGVGLGVTGVLLLIQLIFAIQKHRTIDPLAVAAS
jgi:MATE family multidrug resistance protein